MKKIIINKYNLKIDLNNCYFNKSYNNCPLNRKIK